MKRSAKVRRQMKKAVSCCHVDLRRYEDSEGSQNIEFSFDNSLFSEIDGVAMGSPLGSVLANISIGFIETDQRRTLFHSQCSPIPYLRYVDDFSRFSTPRTMLIVFLELKFSTFQYLLFL